MLACLFRDEDGHIREIPFPRREPRREDLHADLYWPTYTVTKGLFGPARITSVDITILNSLHYRPDPELEKEAEERLLRTIVEREGPQVVQDSGGLETLRRMIGADTLYADRKLR